MNDDIIIKSKSDATVDIKIQRSRNPTVQEVTDHVGKKLGQRGTLQDQNGYDLFRETDLLEAGTYYWERSRQSLSPSKHGPDAILLEEPLAKKQKTVIPAPLEQDGIVALNVPTKLLLLHMHCVVDIGHGHLAGGRSDRGFKGNPKKLDG